MNQLHKRNKRRKVFWTIALATITIFFMYQLIFALLKNNDLKDNKILTTGTVTGIYGGQKNTGGGVDYIFRINNIEYKGGTAYQPLSMSFCESLIGKTFPVIYSSKHFDNSEMLLTSYMFKRFGMEQPDSLKWIEQNVMK